LENGNGRPVTAPPLPEGNLCAVASRLFEKGFSQPAASLPSASLRASLLREVGQAFVVALRVRPVFPLGTTVVHIASHARAAKHPDPSSATGHNFFVIADGKAKSFAWSKKCVAIVRVG
jgi:hypothetical protein